MRALCPSTDIIQNLPALLSLAPVWPDKNLRLLCCGRTQQSAAAMLCGNHAQSQRSLDMGDGAACCQGNPRSKQGELAAEGGADADLGLHTHRCDICAGPGRLWRGRCRGAVLAVGCGDGEGRGQHGGLCDCPGEAVAVYTATSATSADKIVHTQPLQYSRAAVGGQ